jgi:PAS domain S-box-containing protein
LHPHCENPSKAAFANNGNGKCCPVATTDERQDGLAAELYRDLFDRSREAVLIAAVGSGAILEVNRSLCRMFGYRRDEILPLTIADIDAAVPPTDVSPVARWSTKADQRCERTFRWRFRRRDGQPFWGEVSLDPLHIGKRRCIIATIRDITRQQHRENQLRETENEHRSMMEATDDAVYISSAEYRVLYMNAAAIRRSGQDGTGDPCYKAIHDRETVCPWCVAGESGERKLAKYELMSPMDNRFYTVTNIPRLQADGKAANLVILHDTTDTREMERKLQQAQKMEAIGSLAAGIAHDFNNILFPIMGYVEIMREEIEKGSTLLQSLDEIFIAANRAKEMVNRILTFSRHTESERKPQQFQLIVRETLKLVRSSLPATIEIHQYIKNDCGLVLADATQLHQVVMNLLTNAYHAMEDRGGRLSVAMKEVALGPQELQNPDLLPGPYVRLTVGDTGDGIQPHLLKRVFDPYFTTKKEGQGTGMGLSVASGIIKDCGGDIQVSSTPGRGTVFTVLLPVIEHRFTASGTTSAGPIRGGTEHILLVDDEATIVRMVTKSLQRLGYTVTAKTGSIGALEAFRARPDDFDLVVTDLTMPDMTGIQLAHQLNRIRPEIKLILCTGFSEKVDRQNITALGIDDYVLKPVIQSEIAATIRRVLDGTGLPAPERAAVASGRPCPAKT